MKRAPKSREVRRAFKAVRAALRQSLGAVHKAAAERMAKGRYDEAHELAARAKDIREFDKRVKALAEDWRSLSGSRRGATGGSSTTPLWSYYQPILKAIAGAGGECRREDIEKAILETMAPQLQPADRVIAGGGRERWQNMIRRARKGLIAEGWLERSAGGSWRITDSGQRAANSATPLKLDS